MKDDLILLPEERLPGMQREHHEGRPVLVVHNNDDCNDVSCRAVLVAPLSHRVDLKSPRDLVLSAGEANLKHDSIVMLGLLQPILKIDLEPRPVGEISPERMAQAKAMVAVSIGLIKRPLPSVEAEGQT